MTDSRSDSFEPDLPDVLQGRVPSLRVIPLLLDANPGGDIFGGWIMSQMDLAGASRAMHYIGGRVVTVGVEAMSFHKPVFLGDDVSFFTEIVKIGCTSITIKIESWALRCHQGKCQYLKVTEGLYTYVHINDDHEPQEITVR